MSKVIDSLWTTPFGGPIIGLVIVKKDSGEVNILVSPLNEYETTSEEEDAKKVASKGGKLGIEALERFIERAKEAQKK